MTVTNDVLLQRNLIRKEGRMEQVLTARKINDFYDSFFVLAEYNKPLEPNFVYTVLKSMLLKYSILACSYVQETNDVRPVPVIAYDSVVEYKTVPKVDYTELLKDLDKYTFALDGIAPCFKVVIYNMKHLAIVYEHAFFDGGSGPEFLKIFLEYLNNLGPIESKIDFTVPLFELERDIDNLDPLPLAAEEYLRFEPDVSFKLKKFLKSSLPYCLGQYINDHNYCQSPPAGYKKWPQHLRTRQNQKTYYNVINIPPQSIKKIITKCRAHGVTLTPFVEIALFEVFVSEGIFTQQDEYIQSMMPVNLRRYISKDAGHAASLGSRLVPAIMNYYTVEELKGSIANEEKFWKLVSRSYYCVKHSSSDSRIVMNQFLQLQSSYDENSPKKMIKSNLMGYETSNGVSTRFSNLGMIKNKPTESQDTKWRIEDALFSQNIGVNGGFVVLNTISTETKGMNCCMTSVEQVFENLGGKDGFEKFCQAFEARLLNL